MQIVIAWLDEETVMVQRGQPDIGRPHKFKAVPKPMACMWLGNGTVADVEKARAYAKRDGRSVLTFEGEKDPLGRARREMLATAPA